MRERFAAIAIGALPVLAACVDCQSVASVDTGVDAYVLETRGITAPGTASESACASLCAWAAGLGELDTVDACHLMVSEVASDDTGTDLIGHLTCEGTAWAGCK